MIKIGNSAFYYDLENIWSKSAKFLLGANFYKVGDIWDFTL